MIKQSVKKPFTVLVAVIVVLMLAVVSLTQMTTDLLPTISTPYLMVITTDPGASPERVESDVTEPLEDVLSTVNGVVNVTSSSAENYSLITLEFEEDTDMDAALVKVNIAIDSVKDSLPELCGSPTLMEISMDMMATMYVAVARDDMDVYELTDYVNNTILPYFQRQDGVASVSTLGLVEQSVEIRLNEEKVALLNGKLSDYVLEQLDEAEQQLQDAQTQIDDGKAELEEAQTQLEQEQAAQSQQLGEYTKQMNEALATQTSYNAILTSQQADQAALQAEMQAYSDAGVVSAYEQLNDMFAQLQSTATDSDTYEQVYDSSYSSALVDAVQSAADEAGLGVTVNAGNVDAVLAQLDTDSATTAQATAAVQAVMTTAGTAVVLNTSLPTSVEDAIANPDKLEYAKQMLQEAGQSEAAAQLDADTLQQLSDIVNTRIPQISAELNNLEVEIAASQAVLDSVNSVLDTALDNYSAVEAGKITAAAAFGSASAQITSGQSALDDAQTQLDSALETYQTSREEALNAANLGQLLNMETLSALIYAQNFTMPAGYIDDEDDNQWLLKVGDEFESVEDLEQMVLANVDGIGDITLGDVADITIIDNSADSYTRMNGQPAVVLSIFKSSTAGTSNVSKTCNKAIETLMAEDSHLSVINLMDQGDYIDIFLSSIMSNMIFGALLAVLVLALFLRSVKPTLVVAFSIPFSVLVAVLIMYFSGITLNMMSMSGLALGIGMLVDNSIVVIENIYRLRGQGLSGPRAAVQGAKQVAGAIIASTLTTVCVFLPMIFTTGMVRQLLLPFALTISFSLLASLIVALTVVPTMGSVLLRNAVPKQDRLFGKVQAAYGKALGFCLKWKVLPLGVAAVLLGICIYVVVNMGLVLLPDMNSNQLFLSVSMDEGTSLEECYERADGITEQLLSVDGVDSVGAMTNLSGMISTSLTSTSNDYIDYTYYLVLNEDIDKTGEIRAVSNRINDALADGSGYTYTLSESSMGDISSYLSSGLSVEIRGQDLEKLEQISQDVMAMVEEIEGFSEVSNGQEDGDAVLHLTVDKDAAMRCSLTVAQIYSEIASRLTTSASAATIVIDEHQMDVIVVDETNELTAENLMDIEFEVSTTDEDGNSVTETHTLDEFASTEQTTGLATVSRTNGAHTMTVTAVTDDGYNTTRLSRTLQDKLDEYETPNGYSVTIEGETEQVTDMIRQMGKLLALGAVLVYLVMVAQFQSLLSPFIILLTIPLAFTGGLLGMMVSGDQISIVSLLGFLVLMGTVVNNGIVFVDYTNQLRLGGMGKHQALIATGQARMRPILMTALTTILAMSTMMFSTDITANMSRGMAVVVAGGLLYATLMTLFIVPVMYDILYRRQPSVVDVGDDLDDAIDDAAQYLAEHGDE